jgi:hypothetical protein
MNDNKTQPSLSTKKKQKKKTIQPIITPRFGKNGSGVYIDDQTKLDRFFPPKQQPGTKNGSVGGGG